MQPNATQKCCFSGHLGVFDFFSCSCCSRRAPPMKCVFANATFTGGRATARSHENRSRGVECSPAVSDGTCEAACACRIMRACHTSANSEVVSCTGSTQDHRGPETDLAHYLQPFQPLPSPKATPTPTPHHQSPSSHLPGRGPRGRSQSHRRPPTQPTRQAAPNQMDLECRRPRGMAAR